jgi:hypothetical protein
MSITPNDAALLTLREAHDLCGSAAFRQAKAQGMENDFCHCNMLTQINMKELGFLDRDCRRTLLLNEYLAQPSRPYVEALEWAKKLEPEMPGVTCRIPASVMVTAKVAPPTPVADACFDPNVSDEEFEAIVTRAYPDAYREDLAA